MKALGEKAGFRWKMRISHSQWVIQTHLCHFLWKQSILVFFFFFSELLQRETYFVSNFQKYPFTSMVEGYLVWFGETGVAALIIFGAALRFTYFTICSFYHYRLNFMSLCFSCLFRFFSLVSTSAFAFPSLVYLNVCCPHFCQFVFVHWVKCFSVPWVLSVFWLCLVSLDEACILQFGIFVSFQIC